jgi:hypothetical protein
MCQLFAFCIFDCKLISPFISSPLQLPCRRIIRIQHIHHHYFKMPPIHFLRHPHHIICPLALIYVRVCLDIGLFRICQDIFMTSPRVILHSFIVIFPIYTPLTRIWLQFRFFDHAQSVDITFGHLLSYGTIHGPSNYVRPSLYSYRNKTKERTK